MQPRNIFIAIFLLTGNLLSAQNRYALLIGIDKYSPPRDYKPSLNAGRVDYSDLDGCKNDALAMASIVISKFSFPVSNTDTLFDEKATREGILKRCNDLLSRCNKDDIAVIYYAGHGSQVKNSRSAESDGYDESIVPSDTWKEGVSDIRDKEFAKICNQFLDKGVKLTVITDCCHSGSLSRGPVVPGKFRYIASNNIDVKDPSAPVPPETRQGNSFLIISAAQDNQPAQEQRDDDGNPHGAFTIALLTALNQQSVDASALNLFSSLRAILKGNGKKQEPVIGGSPDRERQTLFGMAKGTVPDKSLVPVIKIANSLVELQGGVALSLNKGNELVRVYANNDSVLLRIDTVTGINKSLASVIKGDIKNIVSGQLFEVTNWVSSSAPLLKLYIPGKNISQETVMKMVRLSNELKASKKVSVINNVDKYDPKVSIYFYDGKCYMNINGERKEITDLSAAGIIAKCSSNDTVYVEIPPSAEINETVIKKLKEFRSIKLVSDINDAHYVLYGITNDDNQPAYGLRRLQVVAKDSLESMPLTTNAVPVSFQNKDTYKNLADTLFEYALRLSKIRGWLNILAPTNAKSNFPYTMRLKYPGSEKPLDPLIYKVNENIALYLVADDNYNKISIPQKYIYVFAIDKNGKMTLGYPNASDGNVENKFPKYENSGKLTESFKLFDFTVSEPTGTDNFFLLATDEPITNYEVLFDQDGVRGVDTRGAGENNPLADILNMGNETQVKRGIDRKTPANWCLLKLSVKSIH